LKILKRKPSKICPVCERRFFKGEISFCHWNKLTHCSRSCATKHTNSCRIYKPRNIHQHIKDNSLLVYSGCIEWQGSKSDDYSQVWYQKKSWSVHRLVWTLEKGEIPDGLCVCHKCDNRKCINIEHLFLGTHQDNMRDKIQKGRGGNKIKGRILENVINLIEQGFTYSSIAKAFLCARCTISAIAIKNGFYRDYEKDKKRSLI